MRKTYEKHTIRNRTAILCKVFKQSAQNSAIKLRLTISEAADASLLPSRSGLFAYFSLYKELCSQFVFRNFSETNRKYSNKQNGNKECLLILDGFFLFSKQNVFSLFNRAGRLKQTLAS
jgi:hypothetical protein